MHVLQNGSTRQNRSIVRPFEHMSMYWVRASKYWNTWDAVAVGICSQWHNNKKKIGRNKQILTQYSYIDIILISHSIHCCMFAGVFLFSFRFCVKWLIELSPKRKKKEIIDRTRSTIRSMGISPLDISISKKQLSVTQFQSLILKLSFECPLNAC